MNRADNLIPGGIPKYIRCYDNGGKTLDRYTVVFTGRYRRYKTVDLKKTRPNYFIYINLSEMPFNPLGFCQHGDSEYQPIDKPRYAHLGKKIKFEDLPNDCRKIVLSDYKEIWNINS